MVDNAADYRIEHDTMGEVRVPASALYSAQTQRAVENFPISGDTLEPAQIAALARIKKSAAIEDALRLTSEKYCSVYHCIRPDLPITNRYELIEG